MADQQIKSLGLIAKAIANVRFVLNYGKEARDDPQFEWRKYIIRTVAINIFALYIAYRITMTFYLEEQEMLKNTGLASNAIPADPTDLEF